MPAPFDYTIQQPDANSYFDAVRRGRADQQAVVQDQRNNALAKYLPGALQGDKVQQDLALQNAPVDKMAGLKAQFMQMDAPKLAAVKEFRATNASAAYAIKDPGQWAAFQETQRAEAQRLGIPFADVPFEQKDTLVAMGQTVDSLIDQTWKEKGYDLQRAQFGESARHNRAMEDAASAKRGPGGIDNTTFDNISGLRKEYLNSTKDFGTVTDAFGRIKATSNAATPAGDLSMIYAYMKMLDPGSVVRESEFALAQNAKPLLDRMGISWDSVKSAWEGTKLQPQVRADFLKQSEALYNQQLQQKDQADAYYTTLSNRFGFDPSLVVTGRAAFQDAQPSGPPSFTRGGAGVFSNEPQVASQPTVIQYDTQGRRIR